MDECSTRLTKGRFWNDGMIERKCRIFNAGGAAFLTPFLERLLGLIALHSSVSNTECPITTSALDVLSISRYSQGNCVLFTFNEPPKESVSKGLSVG
jgi:hypothetical protein